MYAVCWAADCCIRTEAAASKQQVCCCRQQLPFCYMVAHLLCHAQECEAILHKDMKQVVLLGKRHLSADTHAEPRKPPGAHLGHRPAGVAPYGRRVASRKQHECQGLVVQQESLTCFVWGPACQEFAELSSWHSLSPDCTAPKLESRASWQQCCKQPTLCHLNSASTVDPLPTTAYKSCSGMPLQWLQCRVLVVGVVISQAESTHQRKYFDC